MTFGSRSDRRSFPHDARLQSPWAAPSTTPSSGRRLPHAASAGVRVLCLGTWRSLQATPAPCTAPSDAEQVAAVTSLDALAARLAGAPHPDLILSHLFWPGGDVVETARVLVAHVYRGSFRAVTIPLPRPEIVRAEVRRVAPDLDFDVVTAEAVRQAVLRA